VVRIASAHLAELTPIEHLILIKIASYSNKEFTMFVAQDTIAGNIGLARETVNRNIKKLVAKGYLIHLPKVGKNNKYRLTMKGIKDEQSVKDSIRSKSKKDVEAKTDVDADKLNGGAWKLLGRKSKY